jgi:hypothetical protein
MKKNLVFAFLFLLNNNLYCQSPNEVVFDKEDQSTNKSNVDEKFRAFNINVFNFLFGDYSVSFEHKIIDKLTGEVGLGMTNESVIKNSSFFKKSILHMPNEAIDNNYSFSSGYSFSFDVKYFLGETFKGIYSGLMYQNRVYSIDGVSNSSTFSNTTASNNIVKYDVFNQKRAISNYFVCFGSRNLLSKKFYSDASAGFGYFLYKESGDKIITNIPFKTKGFDIYYCLKIGMFF